MHIQEQLHWGIGQWSDGAEYLPVSGHPTKLGYSHASVGLVGSKCGIWGFLDFLTLTYLTLLFLFPFSLDVALQDCTIADRAIKPQLNQSKQTWFGKLWHYTSTKGTMGDYAKGKALVTSLHNKIEKQSCNSCPSLKILNIETPQSTAVIIPTSSRSNLITWGLRRLSFPEKQICSVSYDNWKIIF